MPFLEWYDKLSVGCDALDKEHQHMMRCISDLHEAVEQNRGEEVLLKTLDNVAAYANYHFLHEEKLFSNTAYPDIDIHKHEHDLFRKKILDIQNDYRYGDHKKISYDLLAYLKSWLITHIQGTDKGYMPYIQCDLLDLEKEP